MIVGIPRDDQLSKDRAAVRLAPLSRRVAAASPDCGFTHEGEEIKARSPASALRISPKEAVAALKMSIRMP